MAQCLHMDEKGRRCRLPPEEGTSFCHWHDPESATSPPLLGVDVRRRVFRLAALILLLVFLLPLLVRGYRLVMHLLN